MAKSRQIVTQVAGASDLFLDGEKVDGRSLMARHYRDTFNSLALQLGEGSLAPSETALLRRAATLNLLCQLDEDAIMAGEAVDQENYRRNVGALKACLVGLGMAKKSRDVTKADMRFLDQHTAAVLEAE